MKSNISLNNVSHRNSAIDQRVFSAVATYRAKETLMLIAGNVKMAEGHPS